MCNVVVDWKGATYLSMAGGLPIFFSEMFYWCTVARHPTKHSAILKPQSAFIKLSQVFWIRQSTYLEALKWQNATRKLTYDIMNTIKICLYHFNLFGGMSSCHERCQSCGMAALDIFYLAHTILNICHCHPINYFKNNNKMSILIGIFWFCLSCVVYHGSYSHICQKKSYYFWFTR